MSLQSLFENIQLQDLLDERVPPYQSNIVQFVNLLRRTLKTRHDSFFMDFLSYGAFVDVEQHSPQHVHLPNSKCAFKSFDAFLKLYLKNLGPRYFNDALSRNYLIHRITCTSGVLHYEIQVWLQKCTLLHELVVSGVNVNAVKNPVVLTHVDSNPFLRTASRIPVNKQRAKVILALTNPELTTSKRARLENAYQSTF